jgi:hypothetical protein
VWEFMGIVSTAVECAINISTISTNVRLFVHVVKNEKKRKDWPDWLRQKPNIFLVGPNMVKSEGIAVWLNH